MIRSRSHTAGYLPQDGIAHAGKTLADETATAFDDLLAMHARAEEIAGEIDALVAAGRGDSPEVLDLVDEMGKLQHHLEHREGWSIGAKVEEVLFGLGFKAGGHAARDLGVLRRLADAHRARQAAAARADDPDARRADQPPRHRVADLARGVPQGLRRLGRRHLARPPLPRQPDAPHDRDRQRQGRRVQGQLLLLPQGARDPPRDAARLLREPAGGDPRDDGLRRPLPLPGDQGPPGAEPPQAARQDRAHRDGRRAGEHLVRLPAAAVPGAHPDEARGGDEGLRAGAGLLEPRPDARARRPHRLPRLQRRRQVDARADHRRPRADPGRDAHAGPQRHRLVLRAAPGRRPRPEEDRARDARGRRARPACSRGCAGCSAASCSPATTSSSASPCSPAARRAGWRWPRCSWSPPTC